MKRDKQLLIRVMETVLNLLITKPLEIATIPLKIFFKIK